MKSTAVLFSTTLLLLVSAPLPAVADGAAYIGLSAMDFGYKEFDTDGTLLDREDGWLPGLTLGVSETRGRWYGQFDGALYGGGITYRGQVQSPDPTLDGRPIRSNTDELVVDGALQFGYLFGRPGQLRWTAYGGLGYRHWRRDINPGRLADGTQVSGLLEQYRWWYALVGARLNLLQRAGSLVQVDLRLTRTLNPKMDVDFQGFQGLDDATLDLGARTGYRLALPWRLAVAADSEVAVVPFYEAWDIGRSAPELATSGGVPLGTVVEPRSETRNWGVSVNYRRSF